jgi:hypothetical protein
MATDYTRAAADAPLIVFAATYEEATFIDGLEDDYTFLDTN